MADGYLFDMFQILFLSQLLKSAKQCSNLEQLALLKEEHDLGCRKKQYNTWYISHQVGKKGTEIVLSNEVGANPCQAIEGTYHQQVLMSDNEQPEIYIDLYGLSNDNYDRRKRMNTKN